MTITIHPIPLLSIADHQARSTNRPFGILLGYEIDSITHITNAFAVPYEEDSTFFIDSSYLNSMYTLQRKVNVKEKIVGWYSTSDSSHDKNINEFIMNYVTDPIMVIVNCEENQIFKAYRYKLGNLVPIFDAKIEAEEAEEVGVEHLIRDLRDEENDVLNSLQIYESILKEIIAYLGKDEVNPEIVNEIQECLNDFIAYEVEDLSDAYVGSLVKCVVRLKDLEINRKENRLREGIVN